MTLEEKKDMVLQMIGLHPSESWYLQCLDMHMTAEELRLAEQDSDFLLEIKGVLFMEKKKLLRYRLNAIEISASRGGWQGYDKLLQEIDTKLFSINKDISKDYGDKGSVEIYIPENGR